MDNATLLKSCDGRGCGKTIVKIAGIFAIALVAIIAIAKDSIWSENYNTIQVVGQGRVPVAPDAALVNFGVLTIREETSDMAIQKTADAIARVDSALEGAGIPKENRQITGYALNPRYKDASSRGENLVIPVESNEVQIDGYTASQQITVLIPSVQEKAGVINEIVSIATKAGANQVGEVKMVATNMESLKQKARLFALEDARKKVNDMAQAAGVKKVGNVTSWYESVLSAPGTLYGQPSFGENVANSSAPAPSGVIVLQPGQLEVVMEITVSYSVED